MLFFCGCVFTSAQIDDSKKILTLQEKIEQNKKLFDEAPEQAILNLNDLLDEAREIGDKNAELKLMSIRCQHYYYIKIDFEQMIGIANDLLKKAINYQDYHYQAKAHKYLAQAYLFNQLYDKSIHELQSGLNVLDKANPSDSLIIIEKANHYIAFANIYTLREEHYNALRSLKNVLAEHEKLKDPEFRRKSKFLDYANIGAAYLNINLDSAEFYAINSLKLGKEGEFPDQTFINYIVLGNVYKERKDYEKALEYYKKAEVIKQNKNYLNIVELYESFIEVYGILGEEDLKKDYELLMKDFQLTISQNKNNSLMKIIKETNTNGNSESTSSTNSIYYYTLAGFLTAIIGGILFLRIKSKKKIEEVIKPVSIENKLNKITAEKYLELIDLLKKNEQAFYIAFQDEFPEFMSHLNKLSNELTETEIELLMMLKLNLSNKEIAQYRFIQPKTLQNRRNRIRKKLKISRDIDLNEWLSNF